MRAFHALSEDIIAAASPSGIAEKLVRVLPSVTPATAVRLYLYHRRTRSLERVPTSADPEPMAVPLDSPPEGLVAGAVACFNNRTLLNVPDVRRSPLVKLAIKRNLPRSAMFLPLLSHNEAVGVLEVGNARRIGYFTVEEQAAAQHLANQVAASLKLQEQQRMREQLFRSEKLAATGQLISGVASELRAPIESILQLATSLAVYGGRAAPARDLALLAGESQRASEIVSRLVSFARPEDSEPRPLDIHALLAGLLEFRAPEWKTLALRVQNRLSTEPALVIAAQGQLEQVFLNLLVHAEQCAAEAPGKTISISGSLIGSRALIEIGYSTSASAPGDPAGDQPQSPFDTLSSAAGIETGTLGLGVCQGIIQSHGGEIRFRDDPGTARFEIDLPLSPAPAAGAGASTGDGRAVSALFTLLVIDSDPAGQRQLVRMLSAHGHRVVPGRVEEAADLAQRLRFDAVFWALRSGAARNTEIQERVRAHAHPFVLVTDSYDPELARVLENAGGMLLSRPIEEPGIDRILQRVQALSPSRS
jgi:signal transduction histidine kinase